METGKLKVRKSLSGFIKVGKKEYDVPRFYNLAPREKYNNAECEFELDDGTVVKVLVGGQELPKDEETLQEQEAKEQRREAREEVNAKRKEQKASFRNDSFKLANAQVPADTREVAITFEEFDNFALKLNRFAFFDPEDKDGKFKFFQQDRKKGNFEIQANFGGIPFAAIAERNLRLASQLCGETNTIREKFKPEWRLIVGLGGGSVYETSMTLHHVYGIPYIPGSAVKGVVRSWYYTKHYLAQAEEEGKPAEALALKDKTFCDLFGCPAEALLSSANGERETYESHYEKARIGNILFFDAFPVEEPQIEVDIINPHYPEDKEPVDSNQPVPIPFLTVAGAAFQFAAGLRPGCRLPEDRQRELLQEAGQLLREALQLRGIGAKTAVGYGYMKA